MSKSTKNRILRVFCRIHAFEEKKIVKTVHFKILEIFLFLYIFQKCLVDVRQSWSLFIEFQGFHFSSPSGFNAIHAFNMRFHGSKKRIAIILLPIFTKLQFVVSICQKRFIWYHILLLELISFQNLQPPKHRQRQNVNYVMRIQRLHKLQYHRRFLVLFSMLYPLFNKIQINFNETVCERTRFAKI